MLFGHENDNLPVKFSFPKSISATPPPSVPGSHATKNASESSIVSLTIYGRPVIKTTT